jgi:hypothetical protein
VGAYALLAVLLVLLAGSVWVAVSGWNLHGDVPMSGHGYAAMAIGVVFSLIVGCGLMALVFYSHRHGFDEPAEREREKND